MKVIFLDIDGVLNTVRSAKWRSERFDYLFSLKYTRKTRFDFEAVANLNELTRLTGAKIVLTSAWRSSSVRHAQELLREQGVEAQVVGVTPEVQNRELNCRYVGRGREIRVWMRENGRRFGLTNYLILDDDKDFLKFQKPHFVKTDYEIGFGDWKKFLKALKILNRK